jgi:hypothetical protein
MRWYESALDVLIYLAAVGSPAILICFLFAHALREGLAYYHGGARVAARRTFLGLHNKSVNPDLPWGLWMCLEVE